MDNYSRLLLIKFTIRGSTNAPIRVVAYGLRALKGYHTVI